MEGSEVEVGVEVVGGRGVVEGGVVEGREADIGVEGEEEGGGVEGGSKGRG